jgi:inositol hexakisphosphate/diphosphoinositol-pentakisphosphate kinase
LTLITSSSGCAEQPQVVETDDLLEINGIAFHKPFVEKPIDAENHNIYIYFPSDYGGGSQRLFRKVRN